LMELTGHDFAAPVNWQAWWRDEVGDGSKGIQ
jgi:hypothetical protein